MINEVALFAARQTDRQRSHRLISMATLNSIGIVKAEIDGEDGLIVTFSDGTTAGYVVEELLELRPCREHTAEATTGDELVN